MQKVNDKASSVSGAKQDAKHEATMRDRFDDVTLRVEESVVMLKIAMIPLEQMLTKLGTGEEADIVEGIICINEAIINKLESA